MKFSTKACGAIVAGVLALVVSAPTAHAFIDNKDDRKCQETIAKESGKFIKGWLKERAKCADKNLKATGSCDFAKRDEKLDKAESKLRAGIDKKCGPAKLPMPANSLAFSMGFPGKCFDAVPSNGFSHEDLEECIFELHRDIVEALFDLQYGDNGSDAVLDFETQTGDADLAKDLGKCQKELGKNGLKFATTVHKEITKCRNGLNAGKTSGFLAVDCGDNLIEPKPKEKIAKAETKTIDKITGKCDDALFANLDACDTGSGPAANGLDAANCIVASHRNAIDDPDNSGLAEAIAVDVVDIEYALGAFCGDNLVNDEALPAALNSGNFFLGTPPEECDGDDDDACPGACGAPDSHFPCLCTNTPRERVIEHDNSDLDNGWTGTSHDSTVVEGGGYIAELYDCDGPGGPDVLCSVGPSCALAPNQGCSNDAQCGGVGNFCRTSQIDVGPHCSFDLQQTCNTSGDCPGSLNFCRKTAHGIPLPLSSGGVAVCVVNIFSENVTGTTNLVTGSSAVRLRQRSVTHIGSGTLNQPCPSCGNFCSGTSGGAGPGARTLCQTDSDCPGASTCVTDAICSFGPNEGQACRRDPPYGNASLLFGTPSVDCLPAPGNDISSGGLDILFNPSTTGTLTTTPSIVCNAPGFGTKKCIAGTDTGKTCVVDTDCAGGGAGSCQGQCFCAGVGGTSQTPNDCLSACRGGSEDYQPCPGGDSDCPGGFCQSSSCRPAAGVCTGGNTIGAACLADTDCPGGGTCGDTDSSGEGFCPGGPPIGLCSFTSWKGCTLDSECRPSGSCPQCKSDNTETCAFKNKDCFVSEGYTRIGVPGVPDRTAVAHYCIPASSSSAVNNTAGLPGPGALEQPTTIVETGF